VREWRPLCDYGGGIINCDSQQCAALEKGGVSRQPCLGTQSGTTGRGGPPTLSLPENLTGAISWERAYLEDDDESADVVHPGAMEPTTSHHSTD